VALLGDARVVYRVANKLAVRCDRCRDTNYDEVTLACLTCTFPEAEAADAPH
jgi:ribosomal protein L37E